MKSYRELKDEIIKNLGNDDKVIELYNQLETMTLSEDELNDAMDSFEINVLVSSYEEVKHARGLDDG